MAIGRAPERPQDQILHGRIEEGPRARPPAWVPIDMIAADPGWMVASKERPESYPVIGWATMRDFTNKIPENEIRAAFIDGGGVIRTHDPKARPDFTLVYDVDGHDDLLAARAKTVRQGRKP